MLRPRERKRERTIASTWDNSRDKFQGKDKIPNFRFRRDKRELKYINKREGRVVFPTERTKLPREILSFSSRIVRSISSSREREREREEVMKMMFPRCNIPVPHQRGLRGGL